MSKIGDPISILLAFESLHADADGEATIRFRIPATEIARAGMFPVLKGIVFRGIFTPDSVETKEQAL